MIEYTASIGAPENDRESYGAVVPEIWGTYSVGDSYDETVLNIKEALELQLEYLVIQEGKLPNRKTPEEITEEMKTMDIGFSEWEMITVRIDLLTIEKNVLEYKKNDGKTKNQD